MKTRLCRTDFNFFYTNTNIYQYKGLSYSYELILLCFLKNVEELSELSGLGKRNQKDCLTFIGQRKWSFHSLHENYIQVGNK